MTTNVDKIELYQRKQKYFLSVFVFLLIGTLIAVIAVIMYSDKRAQHALAIADSTQATNAKLNSSLDVVASETLRQLQTIDAQAAAVSRDEPPIVYFWSGGFRRGAVPLDETRLNILTLLQQRRAILGGVGPLLASSQRLTDYVCQHQDFVIGESIRTNTAEATLNELIRRDQRYRIAELAADKKDPNTAVIVGLFLTSDEAKKLMAGINVTPNEIRPWSFEQYQPNCSPKRSVSSY
jgi:hypothetical protein